MNISSLKRFDYREDGKLNGIDEPELTFLPNGEAIVLYRDENDSNTGAFLASVGALGIGDLNAPEPTDICASENSKAVAPHIITATGPSSFLGIGTTRNRDPASGQRMKFVFLKSLSIKMASCVSFGRRREIDPTHLISGSTAIRSPCPWVTPDYT